MKQIKVKDTRMHETSYLEANGLPFKVPVVEAKLVLVPTDKFPSLLPKGHTEAVAPYLISMTEKIEEENEYAFFPPNGLTDFSGTVTQVSKLWLDNYKACGNTDFFKILATPKNFSDKQLRAIAEGKIKEGDIVLLECTSDIAYTAGINHYEYTVKFNDHGFITIHHYNNWEVARPVIESALGTYTSPMIAQQASWVIEALNKHYPR